MPAALQLFYLNGVNVIGEFNCYAVQPAAVSVVGILATPSDAFVFMNYTRVPGKPALARPGKPALARRDPAFIAAR